MVGLIIAALVFWHGPVHAQASTVAQPAVPASQSTPEKPWPPAGVARPGDGVKAPRLIKDVKPNYTAGAMDANIQGVVLLEAVVEPDGTVGEVRVMRSLDREFGLDDEAVNCIKRWRFAAGTKDGVPVPVVVEIKLTFTLRK